VGERPKFRTPLCELLGIEYPILQSGMGSIAGPDLAIAVSRAGGLGAFGATDLKPDELREAFKTIRAATDRPFAVNLLLCSEYQQPPAVEPGAVNQAHATLNPFRTRLELPARSDSPKPFEPFLAPVLDAIVEQRPPVFSCALGIPTADLVKRLHGAGTKVTVMVTTIDDARKAETAGADVIIAQGWEAGGHRSQVKKSPAAQSGAVGTLPLVREMVEKVRVPVVAAGGISDGRGLVAALALGASGVQLGTRFVATREAKATEGYKKSITTRSGDDTLVTTAFTGRWARMIRNEFVDTMSAPGATLLPFPWQTEAAGDVIREARKKNDLDLQVMLAGQGIGSLHAILGAEEVVATLVTEAREAMRSLRTQLDP
jgi:nitronate monooxygenase